MLSPNKHKADTSDIDDLPLKVRVRQMKASIKDKDKYTKDYSQTTLESSSLEVADKLSKGCECNVSCFTGMEAENIYRHRLNMAELTKNETDFYLMGLVRASLLDTSDRGAAKRQRKRSSYSYMGKKVCLYAFLYLENITIYQLKKIRGHLAKHGVVNILHGNIHRIPHNAFPLDLYKRTEKFLRNYLENIAHQERNSNKSIVLTQPLSKIYQEYKNEEKQSSDEQTVMGYTTFRSFLRKQFPHVKLSNQQTKPSTTEKPISFREIQVCTTKIEFIEEKPTNHYDYEMISDNLSKKEEEEDPIIEFTNTDDLIYYDASDISQDETDN